MIVTILGTGNAGTALAVLAGSRGHSVRIWSRGMRAVQGGGERHLSATGKLDASVVARCEPSLRAAVLEAQVIVLALPAYGQHEVINELAPHIAQDQMVLLSPAPSAATLVLEKALALRTIRAVIAGTATSLLTAKLESQDRVHVSTLRAGVGFASVRDSDYETAHRHVTDLFGITLSRLKNPLAVSLAYVTPVVHSAMVLGNLSRVELQENWGQFECTTPSIARLCEALDAERMAIARSFGISIPTLVEHCSLSFGLPAKNYHDFCLAISKARNGGPPGPISLESRYVTEDLPFGLAFFSELAKLRGIAVPLMDACLAIMSSACGRAFHEENSMMGVLDMAQWVAAAPGRMAS